MVILIKALAAAVLTVAMPLIGAWLLVYQLPRWLVAALSRN